MDTGQVYRMQFVRPPFPTSNLTESERCASLSVGCVCLCL